MYWTRLDKQHSSWYNTDWWTVRVPTLGISPWSPRWWWLKRHSNTSRPQKPLLFSSWFIIPCSHSEMYVLRLQPFKCKNQSGILNSLHACLERDAKNTHKSCKCTWSLLQALLCIKNSASEIVCESDGIWMSRIREIMQRRIVLITNCKHNILKVPWVLAFAHLQLKLVLFIQYSAARDINGNASFASGLGKCMCNTWQQNTEAPPHAPSQMNSGQQWRNAWFTGQFWVEGP